MYEKSVSENHAGIIPNSPGLVVVETVINSKFASDLGLVPNQPEIRPVGANGLVLENLGDVVVTVEVDSAEFQHSFVVVVLPDEDRLILGDGFLKSFEAIIDWATKSLAVQCDSQQNVRAVSSQLVPPLTRKLVDVRLERPRGSSEHNLYELTGSPTLHDRYFLAIEPTTVEATEDTFKVLLANASLAPAVIDEGASLGHADRGLCAEATELSEEDRESTARASSLESHEYLCGRSAYQQVEAEGIVCTIGI